MKKNNYGFTLIEVIAVVVILGVIFTVAVPAVSDSILDSRKTAYYSTIQSYLETVKGEYEMKSFGGYIDDDEIMIVPIKLVELDKGNSTSTPFGDYLYNRSYVIIDSEKYTDNYYANFLDSANYGIVNLKVDEISKSSIKQIDYSDIPDIGVFVSCKDNKYELSDVLLNFNSKEYVPCNYNVYNNDDSRKECNTNNDIPIIVMCEK